VRVSRAPTEKPSAHLRCCCCPADLFEPRKDAPEDLPRREEAIYLYGVDVMSTKDCLQYFDDYGPTLVEWINDSSCEYQAGSRGVQGSTCCSLTLPDQYYVMLCLTSGSSGASGSTCSVLT
jgi:hypothetical protein